MFWTLMLRIIVSETFSLVYLMWGFKLKKKKEFWGTHCVLNV